MRGIAKNSLVGVAAAAMMLGFAPTASAAATAPSVSASDSAAMADCGAGIRGGQYKYGWASCTGMGEGGRVRVEVWCGGNVYFGPWKKNGEESRKYCPDFRVPDRAFADRY
ncbi:hypothetical protein ACIBCM_20785 [Streptomyces sp. NPDC051018]|uniref:hypothetical protein n=1 Tax=Streptomyces sp. NPDC051018 TaxID=3365639 RepID=UPI0037A9DBA1